MSAAPLPQASARLTRAARLAAVTAVIAAALLFSVPLCPFALITRHPCPGCGLTRATLALLHGHLGEALSFHPLVIVMAPLVIGGGIFNAYSYVSEGRWSAAEALSGRWVTRATIVLGVVMVGVWIARFFGAFGGPVPV